MANHPSAATPHMHLAERRMDRTEQQRRRQEVTESHGGIQPMFREFYFEAVAYAAGRAVAAFERFDKSLSSGGSSDETVASAHEALGHAAAVSRFFFPSTRDPLCEARGLRLRHLFAVEPNSSLQDRELRNALEHFDERLDDYLLGNIEGFIFPGAQVGDASLSDHESGHLFRMVDPDDEVIVLFGKKHRFGTLRTEVTRIAEKARALL